jgi:uncharacterized membrane protein
VHAFVGVVLAIGWAILVIATLRSLGLLGLSLAADRHGRASRKNRQSLVTHVFLPRMIMRVLIMLRPDPPPALPG